MVSEEPIERPTVEGHMGLVHRVAQRFRWALGASLEYEDLVQAGSIGLMKACELFEPERGYRFSSYAMYWVWHHVSREALNHGRTIRVPVWLQDKLRQTRDSLPPIFSLDAPLRADSPDGATHLDALVAPVLDRLRPLLANERKGR
jgi:RNA polymerase sigma factor (sigma-70 family)